MINVMHSSDMPMNQAGKSLDPQLWHACAGGMAQIPPINSNVYYFPQGHAEHANKSVDFGGFSRIPPLIPSRVSSIKYLADADTDEVFAKIKLVPLRANECDIIDDESGLMGSFDKNDEKEKPNSFAKTLTQSDANNGGGFSVPRYCAETIFPRLDYSAEPPVQTILAKDVHNEVWKFRHIYRGTPRRHLLTTGWSNFVNRKKLVAGDSIVFLRAENGDLCIGIRRAKMGIGGGPEVGWNAGPTGYGPSLYRSGFENGNFCNVKRENVSDLSNVRGESVVEAANLAVSGREFEVVYYPRASTPEFVVRASAVRAAMRVQWCVGMRFKMAFETEDSSRISWFMGTIASVQVDDPIRWPNSPWRLLQVAWDEPDLLQNVKRVNPWLVELVSNIPPIHHNHHLSRFSPPRKRARLPQHSEFQQFPISPISPLCCLQDNISAGIQGARHAQYLLSSSSSDLLQFNNLQNMGFDYGRAPLPKMEFPPKNLKKDPVFRLFGQSILTEQQISEKSSSMDNNSLSQENGSAVIQNSPPGDEEFSWFKDQKVETGFETGHCKVFVESEDVGRTLDLTILTSYEELYGKLAAMFCMARSEMLSNLVYSDAEGITKHAGDEPLSVFVKKARRLTILTDSSSDNRGN